MIFDYYQENSGYVSIWAGHFENNDQLDSYLSTVYQREDETDEEFSKELERLFLSQNQNRACEVELKELYDEFYNQFEYDFGFTFDEDFCEAVFYELTFTKLDQLLQNDFSYSEQFKGRFISKVGNDLSQPYNAIILLFGVNYDGQNLTVNHDTYHIDFLGTIYFDDERG
ncbi:immunity 22 family protein [Lysinibacillus sp. NPDC059133]|uniref:immunity 22 family protein n=1 Tax=Lysinibacillus sp. NPDC059133 TaxID=3346737 RepID=UPI0036A46433